MGSLIMWLSIHSKKSQSKPKIEKLVLNTEGQKWCDRGMYPIQ